MITHFIDFSIVNSWIEYKRDCQKAEVPKREIMDLLAFRMKLSEQLVYSQNNSKRTGRITLDEIRSNQERRDKREFRTDDNIRYDERNHYPECSDSRVRCKLESCNLKATVVAWSAKFICVWIKTTTASVNITRDLEDKFQCFYFIYFFCNVHEKKLLELFVMLLCREKDLLYK